MMELIIARPEFLGSVTKMIDLLQFFLSSETFFQTDSDFYIACTSSIWSLHLYSHRVYPNSIFEKFSRRWSDKGIPPRKYHQFRVRNSSKTVFQALKCSKLVRIGSYAQELWSTRVLRIARLWGPSEKFRIPFSQFSDPFWVLGVFTEPMKRQKVEGKTLGFGWISSSVSLQTAPIRLIFSGIAVPMSSIDSERFSAIWKVWLPFLIEF